MQGHFRRTGMIMTVACATGTFLAGNGQAAVNLLYDFNSTSTADAARTGASLTGNLVNGATVSSGTAVNSLGVVESLRTGYLDAPRVVASVTNDARGMYMSDTDPDSVGNTNSWEDYAGVASFATGTVEVVFKPNFAGAQTAGVVHTMFSHRVGDSRTTMALRTDGNQLVGIFGGTGQNGLVSTTFNGWENDSWYYVALSWDTSLATPTPPKLYIRELLDATDGVNPASGTFVNGTTNVADGSQPARYGNADSAIGIGVSMAATGGVPSTGNLDGQMALVRWTTDHVTTEAGFDALYNALLVPEPTSTALLGIGLVMVGRRRSKNAR